MIRNHRLQIVVLLFLIMATVVALATIVYRNNSLENRSKALEKNLVNQHPAEKKYKDNELIVKFASQTPQLSVNKQGESLGEDLSKGAVAFEYLDNETIPQSIEILNQEYQIKEIEKVFKPESRSRAVTTKQGNQVIFDFSKVYIVRFESKQPIESLVSTLKQSNDFNYVEPNYQFEVSATPSDPEYFRQWGLNNTGQTGGAVNADINAPEAWETQTSGNKLLVGIVDTGIDYSHSDLAESIWNNSGETGVDSNGQDKRSNQIDDDANGYVDDWRGWDFFNNDNDPFDDHGHGTHVAGIIGAMGNNSLDITGIAWQSSLVGLKFLSEYGYGDASDAAEAIVYATTIGAKITNNSWGSSSFTQVLYDAILFNKAHGDLFIAAAGNSSRNSDIYGFYPSGFDIDNIISVAISEHNDNFFPLSNFGLNSVDLAAPGKNIISLKNGGGVISNTGTSMSAPFVTGASVLLWSSKTDLSYKQIKNSILSSVDPILSLHGRMATGGRLNLQALLTNSENGFVVAPREVVTDVSASQSKDISLLLINNTDFPVEWTTNTQLPTWIHLNTSGGTILPNETFGVSLTLDSSDLSVNTYQTAIQISYNESQRLDVPVTMIVKSYYSAQWIKSIGSSTEEYGSAIDVDSENNIVAVGRYYGPLTIGNANFVCEGSSDIFIVKYGENGAILWSKRAGGNGNDMSDIPRQIHVDKDNNVYVGGIFNTSITFDSITLTTENSSTTAIFLAKYSPQGDILWAKKIGSRAANLSGLFIHHDTAANNEFLYLTGEFYGNVQFDGTPLTSQGSTDIFLAKYSSDGTLQWAKSAGGSNSDLPTDIVADSSGVYLTGDYSNQTLFGNISLNSYGGKDVFLAKYNHLGAVVWAKTMGGYEYEGGGKLAINSQGNVLVTGDYYGPANFDTKVLEEGYGDIFLASYSPSGVGNWVRAVTYPTFGEKKVHDLLVNSNDSVFVFGWFENTLLFDIHSLKSIANDDFDSFAVEYSRSGEINWTKLISGYSFTTVNGAVSDSNNDIIMVGSFRNSVNVDNIIENSQGSDDFMLIKLHSVPSQITSPTPTPTVLPSPTPPLAVFLDSFTAQWIGARQVNVEWVTTSEYNNMGFNIWRGISPKGPNVKLNTTPISSCSPGGTQGCSYSYLDTIPFSNIIKRSIYYYWIEDIDLNGTVTRHGPTGTDGSGGP